MKYFALLLLFVCALNAQGLRFRMQCTIENFPAPGLDKMLADSCDREIVSDGKSILQKGAKFSNLLRLTEKGQIESIELDHEKKTWKQVKFLNRDLSDSLEEMEAKQKDLQSAMQGFEVKYDIQVLEARREILGQKARGLLFSFQLVPRQNKAENPISITAPRFITEFWMSETIKAPGVQNMNSMMQIVGQLSSVLGGNTKEMFQKLSEATSQLGNGLTLDTVIRFEMPKVEIQGDVVVPKSSEMKIRMFVSELKQGPIAASELEIPEDYIRFQ